MIEIYDFKISTIYHATRGLLNGLIDILSINTEVLNMYKVRALAEEGERERDWQTETEIETELETETDE